MCYLIFDLDYLDIPLQDMPDVDEIIVCQDPQNRLKTERDPITWSVVKTTSQNGCSPPKALGLFWDKEMAERFADTMVHF